MQHIAIIKVNNFAHVSGGIDLFNAALFNQPRKSMHNVFL